MTRVKTAVAGHRRRKQIRKLAKGFRGGGVSSIVPLVSQSCAPRRKPIGGVSSEKGISVLSG